MFKTAMLTVIALVLAIPAAADPTCVYPQVTTYNGAVKSCTDMVDEAGRVNTPDADEIADKPLGPKQPDEEV